MGKVFFMRTIKEYVHFNTSSGYNFDQPFREVMIYQMINSFERNKIPESGRDVEDYQNDNMMTIAQKRRLRKDIIKKANAYVKDHPYTSINDADVIENAFFETDFGKQYAYLRDEWDKNERDNMIKTVSDWTTGQEPQKATDVSRFRLVISPYDPMFYNSDLFTDEHDQLGYIVGVNRTKNQPGISNSDVYNTAQEYEDDRKEGNNRSFIFVKTADRGVDLNIAAVHLGEGHTIRPFDENAVAEYSDQRTLSTMEGPVSKSGYNQISRYIKTNADRRAVKDFLLENTQGNNTPLSGDELKFITETCKWLSDSGIDFDVKVDNSYGKPYLVAAMSGRKQIRLLDRSEPHYQGRIYDNGTVAYVSVPTNNNSPEDLAKARENVTWKDRLNSVKWYFGETVPIDVDRAARSSLKKSYIGDIGEFSAVKGDVVRSKNGKIFSVILGSNDGTVATLHKDASGSSNFTVAYKKQEGRVIPVNLLVKPQASIYDRIMPSFNSKLFPGTEDNLSTAFEYIPESSIYPEDKYKVNVPIISDGEDTGNTEEKIVVKPDMDESHRNYYKHVYAREKLSSWVDSAKENHRSGVDIDGIIETYKKSVEQKDSTITPVFDNEDFSEIQQLYWDVLNGVKEAGKGKKKSISHNGDSEEDSSDVDMEAFDDSVYSASLDDKIRIIRDHYEHYLDEAFGSVPELHKPFASEEENREIDERNSSAGFNPTMVARFMNTNESYSLQRNYEYMRHLLGNLDEEYNHNYLKDDIYMSEEIRKTMLKFDPGTAVCKRFSSRLDRTTGLTAIDMFDDDGKPDYDRIFAIAPDLRNRPVTTEMLIHTAESLKQSGVNPMSVEVNVDGNGIIAYRGVMNRGNSDFKYDIEKKYPKVAKKGDDATLISGTIGQVFEPDENGCIIPNYGGLGESNKIIVPGYTAHLVMDDPDNPTEPRERLRLFDWQHLMKQTITSEIRKATLGNATQYNFLQHTTSLNSVYKHSYDMKISVDEYRDRLNPESDIYKKMQPIKDSAGNYVFDSNGEMSMELVPRDRTEIMKEIDTFKASIDTLRGRCRFGNEYSEGATTNAQSMLEHPNTDLAKKFDYYYSDLNSNYNVRVLGEWYDGIFDRNMTATAKNQGNVRYLLPGVEVNSYDGTVKGVEYDWHNKEQQAELMRNEMMKYAGHDTWDRRLMATTQILTALHTPRQVGVAMITAEGDTFDDGMVVSSDFARRNLVHGADGKLRCLQPQDKLSDTHGNKGVISRVVDPSQHSSQMVKEISEWDISDPDKSIVKYRGKEYSFKYDLFKKDENGNDVGIKEQAVTAIQSQLGIKDSLCELFNNNPSLDVVVSPYSGMSRHNGGTTRELMMNPSNLIVDGKMVAGGMGHMNMIVVDMLGDVKTHFYDEDAVREGKGRKASGQLLWVLEGKRCSEIINEMYGYNDKAWDNLREYMIVTGMDLDENLVPQVGYREQTERGEHRKLMTLPDNDAIQEISFAKDLSVKRSVMNKLDFEGTIKAEMNKSGGFMEVPFELEFRPSRYSNQKGIPDEMFTTKMTGNSIEIGGETVNTYGVPVLPLRLRSGQDFKDGTSRSHDYTNWYCDIYRNSVEYMAYKEHSADIRDKMNEDGVSKDKKEEYRQQLETLQQYMDDAKSKAQSSFDKIVSDVIDKQFNTKYNVFREQCMAAKLPSSATAVVSANASLKSDEVAMSHERAVQLGIMGYDAEKDEYYWSNRSEKSEGDGKVLIWRDPILRDGAIRYMNVVINDSVIGMQMNPAIGNSFSGDFDGDAYGIYAPKTVSAQKEAFTKFHISNNLLDLGEKDPETGRYPLYISKGMDMTSNAFKDPTGEIQKLHDSVEDKANLLQAHIDKMDRGEATIDDFEYEARVIKTEKRGKRTCNVKDENGNFVYERNEDGSYKTETLHGKSAMNACRSDCKKELDEYLEKAFSGIGGAHIIVKDPQSVVESYQQIVDSKAKGDAGKMKGLLDNVGIEYEVDENGKAIASTARNITCEIDGKETICPSIVKESIEADIDYARKKDNDIQRTAAYKADDTAVGGMFSQHAVCAFRNYDAAKIIAITYLATQSILDSKHNPEEATIKDEIYKFWGDDVWAGYKLTGDWTTDDPKVLQKQAHNRVTALALDADGQPIPVKEKGSDGKYHEKYDEDGNKVYERYYVKCTPEEWVTQMKGMMLASGVKSNEDYLKEFAAVMTRQEKVPLVSTSGNAIKYYDPAERTLKTAAGNSGKVAGIYDYAKTDGALFDKLAYDGRFTALVNASLSNSEVYRIQSNNPDIKPSGSIVGNAIEKGVEIYECSQAIKSAPNKDEAKRLTKIRNDMKAEVDAAGMPLPKSIIKAAYDDQVSGSSPRPIGCKDCRSKDPSDRYMGETTETYKARLESLSADKSDREHLNSNKPNVPSQNFDINDIIDEDVKAASSAAKPNHAVQAPTPHMFVTSDNSQDTISLVHDMISDWGSNGDSPDF